MAIITNIKKNAYTETGIPLFTKMKVVKNIQGKTLQEIIDQNFAPQTKVECDGYRSYLNLEHVELCAKKWRSALVTQNHQQSESILAGDLSW